MAKNEQSYANEYAIDIVMSLLIGHEYTFFDFDHKKFHFFPFVLGAHHFLM